MSRTGGSTLSTHVLDTSIGAPGRGVAIVLERVGADGEVVRIGAGKTDSDGRLRDLGIGKEGLEAGGYRLRFDTGAYFAATGRPAFFPEVVIHFTLGTGTEHYHVPLLIGPFGYTTYRGS